jgi:ferredoxin
MRVVVDTEKCVAAGQCVIEASDIFDQREDDGVVVLLEQSPAEDRADAALRAAELCPSAAITIVDD